MHLSFGFVWFLLARLNTETACTQQLMTRQVASLCKAPKARLRLRRCGMQQHVCGQQALALGVCNDP